MTSFDISQSLSIIKPPKDYRGLVMQTDQLICKRIPYSNNTNQMKHITVESDSQNVVIKQNQISIKPRSSQYIQLRMLFPRTMGDMVSPRIRVYSEYGLEQELILHIKLNKN